MEELDTLVNGCEKVVVITTANFVKSGFLLAGGMKSFELVVDAILLSTVGIEDSLALSTGGSAFFTLVVGTVDGVFSIGDFVSAEGLLFVTVSDLLYLELIMFTLLVFDLCCHVVKHGIDV